MDEWFSMISGGRQFAAYDATMDSGNGADVKVARTTTRMYDFVNQGAEFDDLYIYPLLEACRHVIGAPFKRKRHPQSARRCKGSSKSSHESLRSPPRRMPSQLRRFGPGLDSARASDSGHSGRPL